MLGWNRAAARQTDEIAKDPEDERDEQVLCEGIVQLKIASFESFYQINRYTKYLSTIDNLRVLSESWWEDEGFRITLSVQTPLPLESILKAMPEVTRVYSNRRKSGLGGYKKGYHKMVVEMKTSETALEPVPA